MSWMLDAKEAAARDKRRIDRRNRPDRWWIRKGDTQRIVLIDDDPQPVYEHNPNLAGGWKNHFSCPNEPDSPCCKKLGRGYDKRRGYGRWTRYFYTMVDMRKWTDGGGRTREYEMKFLAAYYNSYERIETKRKRVGGLAGWVIEVHRDEKRNDPDIGGEHDPIKEVEDHEGLFNVATYNRRKISAMYDEAEASPEKMVELQKTFQVEFDDDGKLVRRVPAFNYATFLAPPSNEEIEDMLITMVGGSKGGGAGRSSDMAEEDIPF